MRMSNPFIAVLEGEDAKAFLEYDQQPSTQEEIEQLEECRAAYCRHQNRDVDDAIMEFWKL